jgi:2-oxoglutarate dehydrogenase E2 component (dihydrolipoamide succinyltransferase)
MGKTDVIMPQMGESIAEGTIVKWLKKPGDKVKRDEPLFEISTDKVDAEIPSPAEGVLAEIKVPEGQTVEVNVVVGTITDSASAAVAAPAAAPPSPPAPTPAPAPAAPSPARAAAPAAAAAATAVAPARPRDGGAATKEELQQTRSTPVVRKIAAEHGIDIAQVPGTGISGRVTKNDLLSFIEAGGPAVGPTPTGAPAGAAAPPAAASAVAAPVPAAAPGRAPVFTAGQSVVVEPMSIMRKKIAEHMVMSKRTSAHVHTIYEIDCSNVLNTRAAVQD